MGRYYHFLLLVAVLILAYPTACTEIACIIGPNGEKSVGQANITEYRGTDFVFFTDAADSNGGSESHKSQRTVDFAKEDINKKIDRGNDLVRTEGLKLAGKRSGPRRIDQICAIYDCLVAENNWTYVNDWKGLDQYQYANFTLDMGQQEGGLGKGDCDDFSILLASLIESIGATPRIVLAYGQTGGHAYTEVYLGKMSGQNRDLTRMVTWLRSRYNVEDIYTHKDPDTGDIWLNLDWWKDAGGAKHPGGPFFEAADHVPIYIQEKTDKIPLTPIPNLQPEASFSWTPLEPEVDEAVSFSATQSHDPDGRITNYEWSFGDGGTAKGTIKSACRHIYSESGKFPVNLTITDNEGDKSLKTMEIIVGEPLPYALFTYSPAEPVVGDVITFDASKSRDKVGSITKYSWNFDDGYSGERVIIKHQYLDSGTYNVTLTVENDKGVKNSSIIKVNVSQKNGTITDNEGYKGKVTSVVDAKEPLPQAVTTYSPISPKVGDIIAFDASQSKGKMVAYEWDFGDGYGGNLASIFHRYEVSGDYSVKLTVTDDKGVKNSSLINVNVGQKIAKKPVINYFTASPTNIGEGESVTLAWNTSDAESAELDMRRTDMQGTANMQGIANEVGASGSIDLSPPLGVIIYTLTIKNEVGSDTEMVQVTCRPKSVIITWTAFASDPETDQILYKFLLRGPSTNGQLQPVTDWANYNAWTWVASSKDIGINEITVWVRDGNHAGPEYYDDERTSAFTIEGSKDDESIGRAKLRIMQMQSMPVGWSSLSAIPTEPTQNMNQQATQLPMGYNQSLDQPAQQMYPTYPTYQEYSSYQGSVAYQESQGQSQAVPAQVMLPIVNQPPVINYVTADMPSPQTVG